MKVPLCPRFCKALLKRGYVNLGFLPPFDCHPFTFEVIVCGSLVTENYCVTLLKAIFKLLCFYGFCYFCGFFLLCVTTGGINFLVLVESHKRFFFFFWLMIGKIFQESYKILFSVLIHLQSLSWACWAFIFSGFSPSLHPLRA